MNNRSNGIGGNGAWSGGAGGGGYASGGTFVGGISMTSGLSLQSAPTPKGLIVTRAVETKDGWVGQIIVGEQIIWESAPFQADWDETSGQVSSRAEREATQRVLNKVVKMLGGA